MFLTLLNNSKIFNEIGHNVYYMCSNIRKKENDSVYWYHNPIKYNKETYDEIMTSLENNKLPNNIDVIQIFLKIDFMYA